MQTLDVLCSIYFYNWAVFKIIIEFLKNYSITFCWFYLSLSSKVYLNLFYF